MIRKARLRGKRGIVYAIPSGFAGVLHIEKGTMLHAWVEGDKLIYGIDPPDCDVSASYNVGASSGSLIVSILPQWAHAVGVESTTEIDISLNLAGKRLIVRKVD